MAKMGRRSILSIFFWFVVIQSTITSVLFVSHHFLDSGKKHPIARHRVYRRRGQLPKRVKHHTARHEKESKTVINDAPQFLQNDDGGNDLKKTLAKKAGEGRGQNNFDNQGGTDDDGTDDGKNIKTRDDESKIVGDKPQVFHDDDDGKNVKRINAEVATKKERKRNNFLNKRGTNDDGTDDGSIVKAADDEAGGDDDTTEETLERWTGADEPEWRGDSDNNNDGEQGEQQEDFSEAVDEGDEEIFVEEEDLEEIVQDERRVAKQEEEDEEMEVVQDDQEEGARAEKLNLFIHVGPPKTGTTSLQTDLTNWGEYLEQDNYHYVGRFYRPKSFKEGGTRLVSERPHWVNAALRLFTPKHRPGFMEGDLNQMIIEKLKELRDEGKHVIIADEVFNVKYTNVDAYKKLKSYFDDWNVVLVLNYRRLFEWIPSSKFQHDRVAFKWAHQGGMPLKPLFPSILSGKGLPPFRPYRTLTEQCDLIDGIFDYRIIDIQNDQLLTDFLCYAIEDAPVSCAASKERDLTREKTRINVGFENGDPLFYDALVMEAAERDLIDTSNYQRLALRQLAQNYYEEECQNTALDFDQICPANEDLEELLRLSLGMEANILPDMAGDLKNEHIADFWKAAEAGRYCWIDLESTMQEERWISFFQRYSPRALAQ